MLFDLWLSESQYRESTTEGYLKVLERFDRRFPGVVPHLDASTIRAFLLTDIHGDPIAGAPNSVRARWIPIRSFCVWAKRRGITDEDPTENGPLVRFGSGRVRHGRWLLEAEARQLLEACDDETPGGVRDRALIATALLTGLRASELLALRWVDLRISAGVLSVAGKGGEPTEVGLPRQAREALTAWRAHVLKCTFPWFDVDWPVFPKPDTTFPMRIPPSAVGFHWAEHSRYHVLRHIVYRRSRLADIGHVTPHDLRRSFAGFLDRRGSDIFSIQSAMRHRSPTTTIANYLDRDPTRAIRAVEGLEI